MKQNIQYHNNDYIISATGKVLRQRQVKVARNVKNIIADILLKMKHSEIEEEGNIIAVTDVEMTSDLKIAYVYVTSLNEDNEQLIPKLQKIAPIVSKSLGGRIKTKYTPKICFRQDQGADKARRIEQIFNCQ